MAQIQYTWPQQQPLSEEMWVFGKELDVALWLGLAYLDRSSRPQPWTEHQCLRPAVKRMCYNVIVCGSEPQTSLREPSRSATSTPKSFSQVFCHTGSCFITFGSCTEIYWADVWWRHTTKALCLCVCLPNHADRDNSSLHAKASQHTLMFGSKQDMSASLHWDSQELWLCCCTSNNLLIIIVFITTDDI